MNESLPRLLESMRASRAALAAELDQLALRKARSAESAEKTAPAKRFGIAAALVLASAGVARWRRRSHRGADG
jgi:hypothetical protein